jgi:hypothetical protein
MTANLVDKPWYRSKTKWGALAFAASLLIPGYMDPATWAQAVGIALGAFGLRDAVVRR